MLLVSTGKRIADRIKPAFDAEHLRWRHAEVLKILVQRTSTTQQQLLEALQVDASALVGLLNELERDGLVRRVRDPKDRRRHLVEISAAGRQALDNVFAGVHLVERAVLKGLSEDERRTLQRLLGAVRDQMAQPATSIGDCHETEHDTITEITK